MNDEITSDDILGKIALDPQGAKLGVVVKLHVNVARKEIQGITVDQGLMKPDLYVGLEHVRHFGVDAVLLKTIPYNRYKGLKVMTADGKNLGIVRVVDHNGATLQRLIVGKKGKKSEETEVLPADIKEVGQTIILRKQYHDNTML